MNEVLTHVVDQLAATQVGIFILGAIVTVFGLVWLALQFGLIRPKNGNSVHSVTTELRTMNTEIKGMGTDIKVLTTQLPLHMTTIAAELHKLNSEQEKTKENVQKLVNLEDFRGRSSG